MGGTILFSRRNHTEKKSAAFNRSSAGSIDLHTSRASVKAAVWVLLSLIWGLTWLAVRVGLDTLPPFTFAGFRFLLAGAVLCPVLLLQKVAIPKDRTTWKIILGTSLLIISLPYAAQFWGQQYVASGLTAVMFATIPLFGMIFAHLMLANDRLTLGGIAGVSLGIGGVALIFADQLRANSLLAVLGCVGFLVGAAAQALAQVIMKDRGRDLNPLLVTTGQSLAGGLLLLAIGVAVEGDPLNIHWSLDALLALFYLSAIGSALAFSLLYWLIRHVRVTTVTSIALAQSVVAVVAGWIVLGERLQWTAVVGIAAVLSGLGLIVLRPNPSSARADGESVP